MATDGPLHDPHAHKRTSINELLNPVTPSSVIKHELPHPLSSSYPYDHYLNATYTPPTTPPSHQRVANGTYELNPASWWASSDQDGQRLDNYPIQRGNAPGAVPYSDFHDHFQQTHEDSLSDSFFFFSSSPSGHFEASYGSPSYFDERTTVKTDTSTTAVSSSYLSRPDSATATYHHPGPSQGATGAWPHHGRSPAIPTAREPMDYPAPEYTHLPHSAYLPYPAYHSPIPHPDMPYLPPPPSSSPPDSSSRKRAAPDEPPTSRSKMKRSNARDSAETNGSRRGYNANKRCQAAQIAAQNAQLQAYMPVGTNPNDSRASASDCATRPGTENSPGSGGTEETGPLHPELQFARCMSNRYKTESFPRCVSCTRRWAGDTCRFQGIRFFLKDEKQNIVGVSFVENQKTDSPTMKFPTRWNRPLDAGFIKEIKLTVAGALFPTLEQEQEQEHLRKPEIVRRPRNSDVRATCDTCMTSISSSSWMCRLCGREACAECFSKVRELTQYRPGASDSEIAALQAKRESHAHTNPFFLSCTRRNEHQYSDFSPVSRFDKTELEGVVESMEKLLQEETTASAPVLVAGPVVSTPITPYASQSLRTNALRYHDSPSWPPKGAQLLGGDEVDYSSSMTDLMLISSMEDPLRPGVREAVANCGKAGVRVTLCTGDSMLAAKSIAQQCGIYTTGGIVMEGPHFRTLSPDVRKAIVPQLQVLALSSPEDKRILVETLKDLGDVVGVTGGGTNDGPALKAAHVSFSMGTAGAEVAKEASDIILMDDNFSSIVKAMWGRCANDSGRKFLQFQISAKGIPVVTTFVWALASSSKESPLSAVQLLWVSLITDTFATLALATDRASSGQLDRKPDRETDPLFTINMMKQILGQAIYQITVILIFHFLGLDILGFQHTDQFIVQKQHDGIVRTLTFNAFVFAQIFNSFNCRRLDRKLNVFEGMTKNWYFMAITVFEVAVQVLICSIGGSTFDVTHIGAREWAISLALGFLSLPLGALIRLVPNEPCERAFTKLQLLPTFELLPTVLPNAEPGYSSTSSTTVGENVFEIHPDTPPDDPAYGLLGVTPASAMPAT